MTSEYDELLAKLDGSGEWTDKQAAAAFRALTAQVVERDAVIEQHGAVALDEFAKSLERNRPDLAGLANYIRTEVVSRDALAARDAVRDKTVRAKALRDAAGSVRPVVIRWEDHGGNIELMLEEWLHARADQEEL